jgi:F0F1-type ATP synthase membrane subunit b/b'
MHLLADAEFWVLLAVVIFAAAVWKPMRRAVVGSLDERAARIGAELDEARKLAMKPRNCSRNISEGARGGGRAGR